MKSVFAVSLGTLAAVLAACVWLSLRDEAGPQEAGDVLRTPAADEVEQVSPVLGIGASSETIELAVPAPAPAATQVSEPPAVPIAPLPLSAPLRVEVVDALSGNPVEGVRISVRTHDLSPSLAFGAVTDSLEAVTDAAGVCRVVPEVGGLKISAHSANGHYGKASLVHLGLDEFASVRVELSELTTVRGVVTSSAGGPLVGVRVFSQLASSSGFWNIRTDEAGFFEFPAWVVGPASVLSFAKDGYGTANVTLLIDDEGRWTVFEESDEFEWFETEPFIEVELAPERVLRGFVVDDSGLPVEGVSLRAQGLVDGTFMISMADEAFASSEADGSFEIRGLRSDASHLLVVEAAELGLAVRTIPSGSAELDLGVITLKGYRSVTAELTDHLGRPIVGAVITCTVRDLGVLAPSAEAPADVLSAHVATAQSGHDGRFSVLAPPANEVSLQVKLGARQLTNRLLNLAAGDVDLGEIRSEVEPETLSGSVIDSSGTALANTRVQVLTDSGHLIARTLSDESGTFRFSLDENVAKHVTLVLRSNSGAVAGRWRRATLEFPVLLEVSDRGADLLSDDAP
ncbi:MAG: hypothetical protein DHS20C15_27760 [Planctomycetota bacterium]|nr:MAG: hypothetical protein DHS20C15_27760 [Planctomycetota bacterium]